MSQRPCPKCQAEVPDDSTTCPKCGADVPIEASEEDLFAEFLLDDEPKAARAESSELPPLDEAPEIDSAKNVDSGVLPHEEPAEGHADGDAEKTFISQRPPIPPGEDEKFELPSATEHEAD